MSSPHFAEHCACLYLLYLRQLQKTDAGYVYLYLSPFAPDTLHVDQEIFTMFQRLKIAHTFLK